MGNRPVEPTLRQVLFQDVRARDLPCTFGRDLKDLHRFYLDEGRQARLKTMGRIRRACWFIVFLLKSLLTKLTPVRRVIFAAALFMALVEGTNLRFSQVRMPLEFGSFPFFLVVFVLMLELKDKLLARDEIEIARQVQLALLPRDHPRPEGWSLWNYTRPANDVGGDLVDYLDMGSGKVGVALGDVAGKGLGAALLMAKLQATLRALAPECASLAELGDRLNTILFRDGLENRFATLFYLEISPGSSRIRYLNAGHNPPFVLRAGGIETLEPSSRPLGMFPGGTYLEGHADLEPGDLLVVYSDGMTDAQNAAGEDFGSGRLTRLVQELRGLEAEAAGARLLDAIERFLGAERPGDDLSLVTVFRRPPPSSTV